MTDELRALIIEDVEDDALLLARVLKRHHPKLEYRRVETESELREALAASTWDVVLSDYTLPGFGAHRAHEVVREVDLDLPFVIVSGTIGEERAVEAVRAGVDDYVLKDNLARLPLVIERVARDVERKRAQREIEHRLQRAQRLESLGRLAGTIAHDFNNMVMVVESYGHLVLEQLPEEHPACEDVEVMRDAARRASELTRQLLAFSRRQTMQVRRTTLDQVLAQVTPLLGRLLGEDVELQVALSDDAGIVQSDPSQLEQIIMNLAVNARDAMPRGGVLSITTERVLVTADSEVVDVPAGTYACLRVSDTGVGMDRETLQHIFEPFFTTKEGTGGTGLGLSTVYGIVKQSGGDVTVESEPGRGSTFRLLLPVVETPPVDPSVAPATVRPAETGGGRTVLLVEDDGALRRGIRRILERAGYAVVEAADGAEALQIGESHEGPIDLLLTDLVMPHISGRDLVERFAEHRVGTPVVLMSGYAEDRGPEAGLVSEDVVFLPKPFAPSQLMDKIREAMEP